MRYQNLTRIDSPKKRDIFFVSLSIIILSGLVCYFSYQWLISIEANLTLKVVVPLIFSIFTTLGVILVYNLSKLFLYRKKGIRGYKLRGKITLYFLVTIILSILVFSSLIFYVIFLLESTFIEEERKISASLMNNYRIMFDFYQKDFEKNLLAKSNELNTFPLIMKIKNSNLVLAKNYTHIEIPQIISNIDISTTFYSLRGEVFYSKEFSGFAFITQKNIFYGEIIPLPLNEAIPALRRNEETINKIKKLRTLILPVSLISILILSIPILLATFYVSLYAAKSITIPVEKILKGTILLTKNLDYRVAVKSGDELEDLAENFNKMAESLKEAYQKIKRIERIEAWQEVAKKLAHEIKNPLTPIKLSIERLTLAREKNADNFDEIFNKTVFTIIEETKKIENLVNEFSKFLRLPPLKIEENDIIKSIMDVRSTFLTAYPEINFELYLPLEKFLIKYDEEKIKQVLFNLIKNAVEVTGDEKKIIIGAKLEKEFFKVYVRDFGTGIPKEMDDQIFKPYFTTKKEGSGIGLALSERIISEHNGNIGFIREDKGTTFFFELPLGG
ncbi:MAG: ATP-binding protein [Brevinematia bacterium]